MKTLRPIDVLLAHPDTLKNIEVVSDLDKGLLEGISWGFALHPGEENNTRKLDIDEKVRIDWNNKDGFEDVQAFVDQATVPADLPIAGIAEHIISLRRVISAQDTTINNGDAWANGTAAHLKNVLKK